MKKEHLHIIIKIFDEMIDETAEEGLTIDYFQCCQFFIEDLKEEFGINEENEDLNK